MHLGTQKLSDCLFQGSYGFAITRERLGIRKQVRERLSGLG